MYINSDGSTEIPSLTTRLVMYMCYTVDVGIQFAVLVVFNCFKWFQFSNKCPRSYEIRGLRHERTS